MMNAGNIGAGGNITPVGGAGVTGGTQVQSQSPNLSQMYTPVKDLKLNYDNSIGGISQRAASGFSWGR